MTAHDLAATARQGVPLSAIEVIDMHAHLGPYAFSIPDTSAGSIVAGMDRTGITRTLASTMPRTSHAAAVCGNDLVLEAMHAYPARILGYMFLWPSSAGEVAAEAQRCVEAGFSGVKLHNVNGIAYTHPAYEPALALADHHRMPVLLHTWGKDADFAQCRDIAERFPGLRLLTAHTGCSNEEEYCRLALDYPNIYLELAMSLSPRGLVKRLVDRVGADRIVWGSDVCFINQAQQLGKVLGAHIPDEDKTKILGGNARHILDRVVHS